MPSYIVTYQTEIDRDTPLEAARQVDDYMQRGIRCFEPMFFITDTDSQETVAIDLEDYREPEA